MLGDIVYRGVAGSALSFDFAARYFWAEILVGLVLPLALLLTPDIHDRKSGLFAVAVCVVAGVVLNRLNAAVITMQVQSWESYRPAVT